MAGNFPAAVLSPLRARIRWDIGALWHFYRGMRLLVDWVVFAGPNR